MRIAYLLEVGSFRTLSVVVRALLTLYCSIVRVLSDSGTTVAIFDIGYSREMYFCVYLQDGFPLVLAGDIPYPRLDGLLGMPHT